MHAVRGLRQALLMMAASAVGAFLFVSVPRFVIGGLLYGSD